MNPHYIRGSDARQCVAAIYFTLTVADFVARGNVIDLQAPPGSTLIGGSIMVDDTFDTTGTDTIAVGDAGNASRYLGATSLKAVARTPLVPTGFESTSTPPFIRLTRTPADANATKGTVRVLAQYATNSKIDWTEG